jgi:polynucleotide 5'-kinase involved in rRNA processing
MVKIFTAELGGNMDPYSILSTMSGRLIGFNHWDKSPGSNIKSPLILTLGKPDAGKSTLAAMIITDALATQPDCRVHSELAAGEMPSEEVITLSHHRN